MRSSSTDPYFAEAHLVKGKIHEQQGRYEQALAEFKIALALFGGGPNVEALRGHALALAGASEQALEIARQLEAARLIAMFPAWTSQLSIADFANPMLPCAGSTGPT